MKKTKKLLSFFLAIMMVITTIPAFSITASAATINDLKTLISNVETSGFNMNQRKNLKNLYTAYVSACKAYDSYYYGENTGTDITTAYNNLNTAYNAVGSWTAGIAPSTTVTPGGFHNDNGGTYTQGTNYQNLLYNPRVVDNSTSKVANRIFIQDAGVDLEIYYGANTVVYYDGTNKPMIPVFMLGGRTDDTTRNLYTLYPCDESNKSLLTSGKYDWTNTSTAPNKSSVFVMKDKWYGRNGGNYTDMNYFAGIVNNKSRVSIDNSSTFTSSDNHSFDGRGNSWGSKFTKYNQFCNVLVYNTTPTNAIDKCSIVWFKVTGNGANDRYLKSTNDNGAEIYIYVVNYAGILSQINEKSNLFANLSKYKEDTGSKMSTALGYYDTLTSYTYSSINYSSNIDSLKSTLDNAYNGIKAITPTQDNQNGYPAIRSAMDSSMAIFKGNNSDGKYTATSYNAFKTAYTTAKNVMSSVATAGYIDDMFTNPATVATNLNNAITNLVERADFKYYNQQADAVAGNLTYTAKDGQYIRLYSVIQPYESITLYTEEQKADTPKTSQTTVNNVGSAIANANTGVYNSNPVDQTALTSFTTEFANFDTDVYTESVVNAKLAEATGLYKSITFDSNTYWSLNVADQADLDNKLTSYLNAINDSINTYNVTVPSTVTATASYVATATDNGNGTKTYAYPLGTNVTFTNGNADTAWYMAVQSNNTTRGQQYQTYGKSFTTKVVGNLVVTAESAVAETPYYVAIIREYDKAGSGKAIDRVNYVANNSTYTLPTPTKVANYNFAGYVVNGVTKAAGDVITITADTEITAKYQYVGSDLTVTVNGTEKKCAYNESVTVSASGAYAWVEKTGADTWRPFYIGSAVTFRATESTVLKSVTEEEFKATFTDEAYAPNLRLNGVLVDADNRAVFHAQRIDYLPTGAQVVEFGILMNTASSTDFDLENDNVKNAKTVRMKSTQSLDKVQFNIFVKNAGNRTFTYRSYMIYKLADGTVKTVYSDVITKA